MANNLNNATCVVCGGISFSLVKADTLKGDYPEFGYDFNPNYKKSYQMLRCCSCSHIFSFPIPDNIYIRYNDVVDNAYLESAPLRINNAKKIIEQLFRYKKFGTLLDVGCATGDFLSIAKNTYQVEGLELSGWASKIARDRGLIINRCLLSEMGELKKFDIITLWGVIEHFQNPRHEVMQLHRLLNEKGIVAIWTGDQSALIPRLLGKGWWYFMGQHIQIFTSKSLDKLMLDCGFKRVSISIYPYVVNLRSLACSLRRWALLGHIARILFNNNYIGNIEITLHISGEMFAIYEKI